VDDLRVWLHHRIEENKTHPEPMHSNWGTQIFFTMKQQGQDWVERKSTGRK
jgi:hypothetical protein